jgi:hypothetical protein
MKETIEEDFGTKKLKEGWTVNVSRETFTVHPSLMGFKKAVSISLTSKLI